MAIRQTRLYSIIVGVYQSYKKLNLCQIIANTQILMRCYQYFYQSKTMSDEQEFQSAEKECSLQIVHVNHFQAQSLTPRKKNYEYTIGWKFQKIKRSVPVSFSPQKIDTKNISFQTDYMEEASEEYMKTEDQDYVSCFTEKYEKNSQMYKKQRNIGSSWLGHYQYYASVFINPATLAKSDRSIFPKRQPQYIPNNQPFSFSSQFQSGNLFAVYKIGNNQYDLILQNDINSKGNTQWFYFEIANIPAKTKIKFNIVNMLKSDSLFNYGMQPCIHSAEAEKKSGQGWFRSGTAIKYYKNENKVDGSNRYYYTLTFTLVTPYENDTLKVAQSFPYTLQNLNAFLENIEKRPGRKSYLKRQSIGQTIGKNPIQSIKIMQQNPRKKGPRPIIIITGRQHPGETPSSFACEGFLDFISSDDKQAAYLRKNYEIFVLPMLNPDGVMVGNYRTNLCGVDLNRRWDGSKSQLAAETIMVKKYLLEVTRNREVAFMIDLHGHSRKLFSFFYGNSNPENPLEVRLFPYICAKASQGMIRFQDSTFVCEQMKKKTARVQMASKFKIANVFTFQISFFGYINKNKERVHFTQQKIKNLGAIIGKSMCLHQRAKNSAESIEGVIVKKYYEELAGRPELIKCGDKVGSGSETEPEKGEINQNQIESVENGKDDVQPEKQKRSNSKISKKQVIVKQTSKQSRQLCVMDIARVNSIFPNNVLALMPASLATKTKEKQKLKRQKNSVQVQTQQVRVIKIYDTCRVQERDLSSVKKKIAIKNEVENSLTSRSNLFRTVVRPRSSSNSYFEANLTNPVNKVQTRRRHESGIELKDRKPKSKISVSTQTSITFPPDTDFMAKTLDNLMISPVSKGLELIKKKTNFATITPEVTTNKNSSQSFKIGLRALNVETWRIKKKNFQ